MLRIFAFILKTLTKVTLIRLKQTFDFFFPAYNNVNFNSICICLEKYFDQLLLF